jgi:hypothetical protein
MAVVVSLESSSPESPSSSVISVVEGNPFRLKGSIVLVRHPVRPTRVRPALTS